MSQDLLAEFGSFAVQEESKKDSVFPDSVPSLSDQSTQSGLPQYDQASLVNNNAEEDAWAEDDYDFGDFEAAGEEVNEDVFSQVLPSKMEPRITRPTTTTMNVTSKSEPELNRPKKGLSKGHPFAGNSDVLFDAEDSDEMFEAGKQADSEDDFGDFETTAAPVTSKPRAGPAQTKLSTVELPQAATFDLLGLDDDLQPQRQSRPTVPSQTSKAIPRIASKATKNAPIPRPKTTSQTQTVTKVQEDDFAAWDDFESTPGPSAPAAISAPTPPPPSLPQDTNNIPQIPLPTDLLGALLAPPPSPPTPAPTNIPPPSLLLTLFPPLLTLMTPSLLTPLTTLSASEKSIFLLLPQTQLFLHTYMALLHTLAHVVAGRKQRWKRDRYLAQSMKIGPSISGGRSGGMKLTGVDANEGRREDSEVEDVLRVWQTLVGRVKAAVVIGGGGGGGGGGATTVGKALVVPELAAVMPVRIAKSAEGAVASTVACALCGLKREERVAKVDVQVEDSFGEWWVEGTNMHLGCLNFWEGHKESLRGR